jgi:hypothetical protein
LATLLAESLDRSVWPPDESGRIPEHDARLSACPVGLVLNTTLSGEYPPPWLDGSDGQSDLRFASLNASGVRAGSRLIFTNLNLSSNFGRRKELQRFKNPPAGLQAPPARMPGMPADRWENLTYEIAADPKISVCVAAALNANFPPVFPNAPVDREQIINGEKGALDREWTSRYWVTDGGAEKNKGEVTLLYVLQDTIQKELKSPLSDSTPLPDIHVIVVEASAGSIRYAHDQGVGAASGARARLAVERAGPSMIT